MRLLSETASTLSEGNEHLPEIEKFLQSEFVPVEVVYHDRHHARQSLFRNPSCFWPRTPMGHRWVLEDAHVQLMSHRSAVPVKTEVVVFGPNANHQVNYVTLFNGVNMESFSYTRPPKETYCFGSAGKSKQANRYPSNLTTDQYKANNGKQYIRGHCIDYKDTIQCEGLSSNDVRNFLPEIDNDIYWNGIRNWWINDIRKSHSAYIQIPYYDNQSNFHFYTGEVPIYTVSGTLVPKGVFLSEINTGRLMSTRTTYDVSWDFPFNRLVNNHGTTYKKCAEKFITVVNEALPHPIVWDSLRIRQSLSGVFKGAAQIISHEQVPLSIAHSRNDRYQTDCLYYEAENEVTSVKNKIRFSCHLSQVIKDERGKKSYLDRAKSHAEFLVSLDDNHEVVDKDILENINQQNKLENPGFEDTEDLDFWNSIRKA